MKTYKNVVIPETIKQKEDATFCDLCGKEIHERVPDDDENIYVETRITMKKIVTDNTYESTQSEADYFDVCADCWIAVIVPIFTARDAKPRTVEW